ncbi:aldehyde dehydrogenase family protein [Chryseobacterium panacisoli]|uniref:Aldehyde dehydrogenase family protein n=1 Tax=Chryseobacterium panacisoli TaxID=1807141 RepID=A0A5D8ZFZ9_9FLAO|nr:aldehyde dehydrogenase family protein [Chryseobacterium panacisoli]TZF93497.1 aldehyde dehydrogenase family protein [Chryseobacterium panacisoli]
MTAQEAFNQLDPKKWAETSVVEKLHLLEEVQNNLKKYADDLGTSDQKMKNTIMGEDIYTHAESVFATAVPLAGNVSACIQLYESIAKGEMPKPLNITKVDDDTYDVHVFPMDAKDKVLSGTQSGHLRIKGTPKQVNPLEKPAGVTAILGAGNYSSSLEMVKALFYDNKAVIHKPHHLNEETDAIWEKIFQPIIDFGALRFVSADQGRELTTINGLTAIYFTGGTGTAKAIMSNTNTPMVAECGGNNPCIIVPGDRPWTKKEMEHQANQIATVAKLNGGAVCGRPQTLVTSRHWEQRNEFLNALRKALSEDTPAAGAYYPGTDKAEEGFKKAYPNAEILKPENGRFKHASFMLITDCEEDSYATQNEAFCQIMDEVALDIPANAKDFLPKATAFCNDKLLGSLGCMLLIDEDTKKAYQHELDTAVTHLKYGGIAVNTIPVIVFLSPYLTWGGNEQGKEMVSGSGNFGNLLGFENIEKSIVYDKFVSPGHMLRTNQKAFDHLAKNMASYSMEPTWRNLTKMAGIAMIDGLRKKDF